MLFRSLPTEWKEGAVKGLRARGGSAVTVDMEGKEGKLVSATLHAAAGNSCAIRYGKKTAVLFIPPIEGIKLGPDLNPI